ncbi:MAG TPA: hypothetical protein VLC92_01310 [Rhodocyclaceae bacterium]|nr:hypothetical protein [Rhodocyclaceae bacterium]
MKHQLISAALLFASTFLLVFFLGLQSRNVNSHQYRAAFFTSFGIGISQLILYKLAPSAGALEIAAYLLGGPFGIVAAMRCHSMVNHPRPHSQVPPKAPPPVARKGSNPDPTYPKPPAPPPPPPARDIRGRTPVIAQPTPEPCSSRATT